MKLVRHPGRGLATLACAGLLFSACGDDEGSTQDTSPLFEVDTGVPDAPDTTLPDTTVTDTVNDTRDVTDTRDTTDTNPPDLVPDTTPPTVVSTTPTNGAAGVTLPLTVTITFSEAILPNTIATQTVKLYDWLNNEIPGTPTLSADGKTVTWRPTQNNQQLASEYRIWVAGQTIKDTAGLGLANTFEARFITAGYPNQNDYFALAANYAPHIYSAVANKTDPHFQIPTKLDADGNWNLADNRSWIAVTATSVTPAVYYTVTETITHYFVQYSYYFPYVNHPTETHVTGNGMATVLVVVEKERGEQAERPIAAYTFWKETVSEENYAFATTESGLIGSGGAGDWGFKEGFAQAALFPEGHFESYITAGSHRSCNWNWNQGGAVKPCETPSAVKNGDTLVFKYLGTTPTPVVKADNKWPNNMTEAGVAAYGYELIPVLDTMWARRAQDNPTQVFTTDTFTYAAESGRPGNNTRLATRFIQSVQAAASNSFGKPPWSWGWLPAGGEVTFEIGRGISGLDPAWYVWRRHRRANTPTALVDYDAQTGAGFSLVYCFNGYLNTDGRTTEAACVAQ